MPIQVTQPILKPAKPTRHTGGHSGGHAHSVAAPKAPRPAHVKAPKVSHHRGATHARGSVAAAPAGSSDALKLQTTEAYYASVTPQVTVQPSQAQIDAQPGKLASAENLFETGSAPAAGGANYAPAGQTPYAMAQAANQAEQHQNLVDAMAQGYTPTAEQAKQFHVAAPAAVHIKAPHVTAARHARSGGSTGGTPAAHHRKVTAPLQLSESGLLGHDSHISAPTPLGAIPPVVRRRPH